MSAHAAAIGVIAATVLLAFFPVVVGEKAIFGLDRYLNPLWEAAAWGFERGGLPPWAPHIRAGYPLFANGEASIAYPPAWPVRALLPVQPGIDVFVLGHLVAAGWAMWLYLRTLAVQPAVALLGGVAFALSGRMVASTIWAHAVATSVALPLILVGVERAATDRRRGLLWVALGFALGGLAGRPQRLLPGLVLAGGYALFVVLWRNRATAARWRAASGELASIGLGALLGLGVAAVQLLPTAAFVSESTWGSAVPRELFEAHALGEGAGRGLFLPAGPDDRIGTRSYPGVAVYAGLALALVGLVRRRIDARSVCLVGGVLVCAYFAAAGPGTYELFGAIPGLRSLRAPVRFLFPVTFGLVAVAALSGDRWLRGRPRLAAWAVLAAGAVELVVAARAAAPLAPREVYTVRPRMIDLYRADLIEPDAVGARPRFASESFLMAQRFVATTGEKVMLRRFAAVPPAENLAMRFDLRRAGGYGEPQLPWVESLFVQGARSHLDQLGTRALFLTRPDDRFEQIGRHGRWHVYRNPDALPRAICVSEVIRAASAREAGARATAAPFEPLASAVIETDVLPVVERGRQPGDCPIQLVSESGRGAVYEVESPGPRVLVVFDAWAPDWSARLDGEPVPLLRANGMFRAVAIPAGRSRVAFDYWPHGLTAGAAVSAASLAVLASIPLLPQLRRGRSRDA